jgi:hypothetical protein
VKGQSLLDEHGNLDLIGNIGGNHRRFSAAIPCDDLGSLSRAGDIDVGNDERGTVVREAECNLFSDALAAPGYDGDLVV